MQSFLGLRLSTADNRTKKGVTEWFTMSRSSAGSMVFGAAIVGMFFLLMGGCWAETFEARVAGVSAGDIFKVPRGGQSELVVLYGVEAPSTRSLAGKEARRFAAEEEARR